MERAQEYLAKIQPHLETANRLLTTYEPLIIKVWEEMVYPTLFKAWGYYSKPEASILLGVILLFWGGNFVLTVAVIEAFRLLGLELLKQSLENLYDSFIRARAALEKDNDEDAAVDEISILKPGPLKDLVVKMRSILRAVDPEKVSTSLTLIGTGFITALATLQSQAAQTITMGASISALAISPFEGLLEQRLKDNVPAEYKRWAEIALSYTTKTVGITLAYLFQPWILITNLSMKSAVMIVEGLIESSAVPEEYIDKVRLATPGVAVVGVLWQLFYGSNLPFLFWIFLWPGCLFEWIFSFFVVATVATGVNPVA